jgi:choline dehydrogenase-like flavoprotein
VAVSARAAGRDRPPRDRLAARQGARRLERDQRLIYIRGQHADFDDWAALGAHGWSYRDVLPIFKRSERYDGGASEYHGAEGELCVSDLRNDHSHCAAWVAAGAEAGYPLNPISTAPSPTASAPTS